MCGYRARGGAHVPVHSRKAVTEHTPFRLRGCWWRVISGHTRSLSGRSSHDSAEPAVLRVVIPGPQNECVVESEHEGHLTWSGFRKHKHTHTHTHEKRKNRGARMARDGPEDNHGQNLFSSVRVSMGAGWRRMKRREQRESKREREKERSGVESAGVRRECVRGGSASAEAARRTIVSQRQDFAHSAHFPAPRRQRWLPRSVFPVLPRPKVDTN